VPPEPAIRLAGPEETEKLGEALAGRLRAGDVVTLSGDLGAGKTTFARGVLRGLGFQGDVASPTFPIVLAYEPPDLRLPLWHVDLYRIEDPAELEELALDEAMGESALLIEWPERLPQAWRHALQLRLDHDESGGGRALTAHVPPAWEGRWPPR
jgi:tRNA threonylcarbamoyladenosine biosynthesis protein TsaE